MNSICKFYMNFFFQYCTWTLFTLYLGGPVGFVWDEVKISQAMDDWSIAILCAL